MNLICPGAGAVGGRRAMGEPILRILTTLTLTVYHYYHKTQGRVDNVATLINAHVNPSWVRVKHWGLKHGGEKWVLQHNGVWSNKGQMSKYCPTYVLNFGWLTTTV